MITVFFGDVNENTANVALNHDVDATLVDNTNAEEFISNPQGTVYTSLGDLDQNIVFQVLDKADRIVYVKNTIWSDGKDVDIYYPTESIQGLSEYILWWFSHYKHNVEGLDLSQYQHKDMLFTVDTRKSENPQLWVLGSSFALGNHGIGKNAYPYLLAKDLGLELSLLAIDCASTEQMSDQLLRSDVRENDIVVVSLNYEEKQMFWNSIEKSVTVLDESWCIDSKMKQRAEQLGYKKLDLDRFLFGNDTGFYKNFTHIHQIINFCKIAKAKLFLFGLYTSDRMNLALGKEPLFKNYRKNLGIYHKDFVDLAEDNKHPGPKQHRLYADFILDNLKALEYI